MCFLSVNCISFGSFYLPWLQQNAYTKRDLWMDALWVEVIISLNLIHGIITKITERAIPVYKQFSVGFLFFFFFFYLEIPCWRSQSTNARAWLYSKVLILSGSWKFLTLISQYMNVVWSTLHESIPSSVNFLIKFGIYI